VRGDEVTSVAYNDDQVLGINASRRGDRMAEEGASPDGMQNLGCGRLHPGAFASGKDDDSGRAGCSHAMSS
jgi:hypothetical protein